MNKEYIDNYIDSVIDDINKLIIDANNLLKSIELTNSDVNVSELYKTNFLYMIIFSICIFFLFYINIYCNVARFK